MGLVLDRVQTVTNADGAAVELADGNVMVHRAVSGLSTDREGTRNAGENSLSGLCVRVGMPLLCRDTETDPGVDAELCRRTGIRSIAVAPMVRAGEPSGVLRVMSSEAEHFDDADVEVLELMANLWPRDCPPPRSSTEKPSVPSGTRSLGSPIASSSWIVWRTTAMRLAATAGPTGSFSSAWTASPS